MKIIALPSLGTRQPTMLSHSVMANYKRHNQGYRAHVRRQDFSGYWIPKYKRGKRIRQKLLTHFKNLHIIF